MTPSFSFDVDDRGDLVTITISGFFQPNDIPPFVLARDAAHQRLRCGPGQHVTLVDMRSMAIQPQESVQIFKAVLENPRLASRQLAFVTGKSLARLQIQRAAENREARFFTDVADARSWLLSPAQQAA